MADTDHTVDVVPEVAELVGVAAVDEVDDPEDAELEALVVSQDVQAA